MFKYYLSGQDENKMSRRKNFYRIIRIYSFIILFFSNMFIFAEKSHSATSADIQQQITITGVVTDTDGEPLPGVSVMFKGTTQGITTDVNGAYSLTTSNNNATLVFSFLGFVTQELLVGDRRTINVTLREDVFMIDEVVIVGYGTQKKVNLSGAVSQVSGAVLENRPITNLGQGLQGVIPNLQITPVGNAPGQGSSFNVRGYTSLNGGQALVLVDGVVQDPNLVNPNDIESVSVLKDAASAAIYGARAAFGVVLITTKKGLKNQKPSINVSGAWTTNAPTYIPRYMDSMGYMDYYDIANRNNGGTDYFNPTLREYARRHYEDPVNNPSAYLANDETEYYTYVANTDWAKELYKNGSMQQYNISMSGGSENTQYFVSYGLMDLKGILVPYKDSYKRHNMNVDLSTDVFKWLTFGAKARYTYGFEDHPSGGMGSSGLSAYGGMLKNDLLPLMPVRHPDGNYAGMGWYTNPVAVGELGGHDQRKANDFWITGKLTLRPFEGFNLNTDFTYNPYSWNREYTVLQFKDYRAKGQWGYYPWTNPSQVTLANNNDYYTAFNAYADYAVSFKNHNFKILAGYNQEIKTVKYFMSDRKNLITNELPAINRATGIQTVDGSITSWAVQGAFLRFNYDYDEKYLLEINGRYDGSSKFASGNRFDFFPSFSAAWRISKESFMDNIQHVLSELKVRASYGSLGNQNVSGDFVYVPSYNIDTDQAYIIGTTKGVAITAPGLVSAGYTWETVKQWNIGLDFGFLKNRLNGSFDFFQRDTQGMLTSARPLPGVLGTDVPRENAADLKTVGWDFIISWRDRPGSDFNYHVTFVLSDALAEITKFDNPTGLLSTHYVGKKIGEVWGYKTAGLFQSESEIESWASQIRFFSGTWNPGDVKYIDIDGDGEVFNGSNTLDDHGDLSIIGNTSPRFEYGITLGASWKGFDIDAFFQGVGKRDYWPEGRFWGIGNQYDVPLRDASDFWTPENTGAYLPRPYINGGHGNRQTSDRYLQNAAYLRFKQFSIGYTIPPVWTEKIAISRARIYFTGQNMFTWTKLSKVYDPEIIGTSGSATNVVTTMTYPVTKAYSIGINLTF